MEPPFDVPQLKVLPHLAFGLVIQVNIVNVNLPPFEGFPTVVFRSVFRTETLNRLFTVSQMFE
jgi:hypothetical protein